jgi:hypothetical protein
METAQEILQDLARRRRSFLWILAREERRRYGGDLSRDPGVQSDASPLHGHPGRA